MLDNSTSNTVALAKTTCRVLPAEFMDDLRVTQISIIEARAVSVPFHTTFWYSAPTIMAEDTRRTHEPRHSRTTLPAAVAATVCRASAAATGARKGTGERSRGIHDEGDCDSASGD